MPNQCCPSCNPSFAHHLILLAFESLWCQASLLVSRRLASCELETTLAQGFVRLFSHTYSIPKTRAHCSTGLFAGEQWQRCPILEDPQYPAAVHQPDLSTPYSLIGTHAAVPVYRWRRDQDLCCNGLRGGSRGWKSGHNYSARICRAVEPVSERVDHTP